ncbi:ABC transporter ATP-binding protein [Roseovarius sp. HI0049]|nr:ABC transporter ATP-binding protein [Roseovarius sp. HI0049]
MIKVSNLSYDAGGTRILSDVSVEIPSGGITALIGPNGAGKSTLLHCLAGLHRPAAGEVHVDGAPVLSLPDRDRARAVALLQQSQTIVNRLTVRELVAFGRWPHHQGRPGPEDARLTQEALDTFDLGPMADRALDTLSGGQRQRAQVAMVWAQSTPWLLLDEPLNALDPKYARDLMHRLHELTRPGPVARSVVVVLHDINAAAAWADRVIAMKDGKLHAHGDSADILTPGILGDLYETRFDVLEHGGRPVVVSR